MFTVTNQQVFDIFAWKITQRLVCQKNRNVNGYKNSKELQKS